MVIWLTGLSGAGKTTIGTALYKKIKAVHKNTVFLDGDIFRNLMQSDLGYSVEDRRKNAFREANLCKMLDEQQIHVVCCILCNQPEIRESNRKIFKQYFEVFIDVSINNLIKRDPKGLYKRVLDGKTQDVVGVDIKFYPPKDPDMVIDNNDFVDIDSTVNQILERLSEAGLKMDSLKQKI